MNQPEYRATRTHHQQHCDIYLDFAFSDTFQRTTDKQKQRTSILVLLPHTRLLLHMCHLLLQLIPDERRIANRRKEVPPAPRLRVEFFGHLSSVAVEALHEEKPFGVLLVCESSQ